MRIAACLLIASLVVTIIAPRVLVRLTDSGHAPRLGGAAWLAASGGVLAAWAAAPVLLALDFIRPSGDAARLARECLAMLRTTLGDAVGTAVQVVVLAAAALLVARLGWRLTGLVAAG